MDTENQNTEGSQTSDQSQAGNQPDWKNGQLGKIIEFVNQPAIASALAGLGLYFAIDPKAIKTALDEVQQSNEQMIEKMNELIEENVKIKKQLKKLARDEDENEADERQMNGYRKAANRNRSVYLD